MRYLNKGRESKAYHVFHANFTPEDEIADITEERSSLALGFLDLLTSQSLADVVLESLHEPRGSA